MNTKIARLSSTLSLALIAIAAAALGGCATAAPAPADRGPVVQPAAECHARPDLRAWCADNGWREGFWCGEDPMQWPASPVEADLYCR